MIRGPRSNDLTERLAFRVSVKARKHIDRQGSASEYLRDLIAADMGMLRLPVVKLPMLLKARK